MSTDMSPRPFPTPQSGETAPGTGEAQDSWDQSRMDPTRIGELIAGLTPEDDIRMGRKFGVHVLDGQDSRSDIGRFIEWQVFQEFFPSNNLDLMKNEYGAYDDNSTFLVVLDYENQAPVGVIRMVRPEGSGLKSLDDLVSPKHAWHDPLLGHEERLAEMGDDYEHSADIATFAVMPDYRSGHAEDGASASLYSTSVRWSLSNGYNNWISIIDKKPLSMIQTWGEPFIAFEGCDFAPFLDSKASLPVHLNIPVALEQIREKLGPEMGQTIVDLYTKGSGLESSFVLPDFS